MKSVSSLIFAIMLGLAATSCAGMKSLWLPKAAAVLPEIVPESFHFNVKDFEARKHFSSLNPDDLSEDQVLEVVLLRELATVSSSEEELRGAFDRLWDNHEGLRHLIRNPAKARESIRAAAIAYYLLSSMRATSWQDQTAERLYEDALKDLDPARLTGYSLHFYTLALLKNAKFEAVFPFLERLKHQTLPRIYLQDLLVALDYASSAREERAVCRLMVVICQTSVLRHLEIPEDELKQAIAALRMNGNIDLARQALVPIIQANPRLLDCSLVPMLGNFHDQAHQGERKENSDPTGNRRGIAETLDRRSEQTSGIAPYTKKRSGDLLIAVQVIRACRDSTHVDPILVDVITDLRKKVQFSGFTFVAERIFHLALGEEGRMTIPMDQTLRIKPIMWDGQSCRIEAIIIQNGDLVFSTVLDSIDGGSAVIGRAEGDGRMLLLRLTSLLK